MPSNKNATENQLNLLPPSPAPDIYLVPDLWTAAARRRAARRIREHAQREALVVLTLGAQGRAGR